GSRVGLRLRPHRILGARQVRSDRGNAIAQLLHALHWVGAGLLHRRRLPLIAAPVDRRIGCDSVLASGVGVEGAARSAGAWGAAPYTLLARLAHQSPPALAWAGFGSAAADCSGFPSMKTDP